MWNSGTVRGRLYQVGEVGEIYVYKLDFEALGSLVQKRDMNGKRSIQPIEE